MKMMTRALLDIIYPGAIDAAPKEWTPEQALALSTRVKSRGTEP
jgi:hypothetical protein